MLKMFKDLLKRGNLPDDTRHVPNWLKIKNRQFDGVDFKHNSVEAIIALSSPEFNEFITSVNHDMLFVYLSTMSDKEMRKFYHYLDTVVTIDESSQFNSSKEQFEKAMSKVIKSEIPDEQFARATLEMPLIINYAKHLYHTITQFSHYISKDYYHFDEQNAYKLYEGHLSKIIWGKMNLIPDHFEQVINHFYEFYDENNEEHKKFFIHLSNRFGLLIATLSRLIYLTEDRVTSMNWFVEKMVAYELLESVEVSVGESQSLASDKKLINFLTLMFAGICDKSDDHYLENLIHTTKTLFEWYPINRQSCEYAMQEMMKSVALKTVNVENANSVISFFETLPRFYEILSYDTLYELKELINHTIAQYKPTDNPIFDNLQVKNKIILLNYLVDMEDLYYESGKQA